MNFYRGSFSKKNLRDHVQIVPGTYKSNLKSVAVTVLNWSEWPVRCAQTHTQTHVERTHYLCHSLRSLGGDNNEQVPCQTSRVLRERSLWSQQSPLHSSSVLDKEERHITSSSVSSCWSEFPSFINSTPWQTQQILKYYYYYHHHHHLYHCYCCCCYYYYYSLRSSSQELLTVPRCKTMLGRRRFSVAAPRVWNSLPLGLKTNCDSLRSFKTLPYLTLPAGWMAAWACTQRWGHNMGQ